METVATKKKRVALIEYENSFRSTFASSFGSINNKWNILRRTFTASFNSPSTNGISHNLASIKQEISTYEEISSQLYSDLVDLQAIQQRIEYSRTLKGKYFNVLGYFFSLYCVWKIFISFINIVFNRVGKGKQSRRWWLSNDSLADSSWSGDTRYWIDRSFLQPPIRCSILVTICFIHIDWHYRCHQYSWSTNHFDQGWNRMKSARHMRSRLCFFSSSTSSPVAGLRTSSFYALLNWWFVRTNASFTARSRLFRACILFRRSSLFEWICQHNTGTNSFEMISRNSSLSLTCLDKSYRSFLVIYNSISTIGGSTASSCFPHSSVLESSTCTIDPPNNHFHSMTRMFKRRLTRSQSKE